MPPEKQERRDLKKVNNDPLSISLYDFLTIRHCICYYINIVFLSRGQGLYMTKKKKVSMAMNVFVNMTSKNNKAFLEHWKQEKVKEQKRVSLTQEALEFINRQAFEDFGITQSSFSKEVTKLILIAKDCLEKESKK